MFLEQEFMRTFTLQRLPDLPSFLPGPRGELSPKLPHVPRGKTRTDGQDGQDGQRTDACQTSAGRLPDDRRTHLDGRRRTKIRQTRWTGRTTAGLLTDTRRTPTPDRTDKVNSYLTLNLGRCPACPADIRQSTGWKQGI